MAIVIGNLSVGQRQSARFIRQICHIDRISEKICQPGIFDLTNLKPTASMTLAQTDKRRICRTCGTDFTPLARYSRWNECSVCYCRRSFESYKSIPDLESKHDQLQQRLTALSTELSNAKKAAEKELYDYMNLPSTPWFKRLLGPKPTARPLPNVQRYQMLNSEVEQLRSEQQRILFTIERARDAKNRYTEAQLSRAAEERRQKQQHQKQAEFSERSAGALANQFERSQFHIQAKDYRRGNAIDNYCRNVLEDVILATFDHRCTFCGSNHDLTFDHYGLTKNEGGNFILLASDKQLLRINLVVLCRSCNSTKSQRLHRHFFTEEQQREILRYQQRFLSIVLNDVRFMKMLKKWAK
ncbi:MAG: hypothetical protein ACLQHK_13800 [Gallionellaceae bacterium]